jgi:hypothetical protein
MHTRLRRMLLLRMSAAQVEAAVGDSEETLNIGMGVFNWLNRTAPLQHPMYNSPVGCFEQSGGGVALLQLAGAMPWSF